MQFKSGWKRLSALAMGLCLTASVAARRLLSIFERVRIKTAPMKVLRRAIMAWSRWR